MASEKAIFTNMCMICDGDKILVQNRLNPDWPGLTFPGGHVEPQESFVDSVIREVKEETGLTIKKPQICGLKQFLTENNERYVVLFFKTNKFSGDVISSREGEVFWIRPEELTAYPLAEDFLEMYQVFVSDKSEFYYFKSDDGKWQSALK